jgi:hypothetical protein
MSLLAILDFTLVMKFFWLSCMGLCCPEYCNCVVSALNRKSMVLHKIVVSLSELVVFLDDSFVTTVFCQGFFFKRMNGCLSSWFMGLIRTLFNSVKEMPLVHEPHGPP